MKKSNEGDFFMRNREHMITNFMHQAVVENTPPQFAFPLTHSFYYALPLYCILQEGSALLPLAITAIPYS